MTLRFMWAVKKDGRYIEQFDRQSGKERRFGDIDIEGAEEIAWVIPPLEAMRRIMEAQNTLVIPFYSLRGVHVRLDKARKPIIHFERQMCIQAGAPVAPVSEETSYVIGFEENEHKFVLKIRPNGIIEVP